MLQLDHRPSLTIEIRETSSLLDDSLNTIGQYLLDRYTELEEKHLQEAMSHVHIDLDALGFYQEGEKRATRGWTCTAVCPLRLYHSLLVVGPLYRPAQRGGPCPRCLELRWLAIRSKEEQQALLTLQEKVVVGHNPRLTSFALDTIWSVLLTLLRAQHPLADVAIAYDQFYAIELDTLQVDRYRLIPDSFCPICATPRLDTREEAIVTLSSRPKRDIAEYRLVKPLEYDLPEIGYINPVCGMLGATTVPEYLHTVTSPVSGKFSVKSPYAVHDTWWGGHGNSYVTSQRLGLLEGLERYTGHRVRAKTVAVFDSYRHLAADALNPVDCGMYEDAFYNRMGPPYTRFSPDIKLHWVWGYSFRQQRPILVPEQLAFYLHYRSNDPLFVQDCSNGCATGSSLEEAILFGLLELIERDGFLLTWYTKVSPHRIDPWSCQKRHVLNILDRINRQGYDIHLLDTRFDIRIPSITAIGILRSDEPGKLVLAAGSSLDPEDAIRSALCEVAAYIPGFRARLDKSMDDVHAMSKDYRKVTALQHHPLVYGLPEMAAKAAFLYQSPTLHTVADLYRDWYRQKPQTFDLLDDLNYCIGEILRLNMDVIVVDQTCPELDSVGLKAASVIVPGLIPIDFGWGRHRALQLPRLRTAPRVAGYLAEDFDPSQSNLMPHPFP